MAPRRHRTTARDRSRRVLSQNFLADPAAVARMVRAARPGPDDLLLEVGAGRGQLTRPLAAPGLRSATLLTQLEYARKRTGDHGRWSRLTVLTWPEHHWRLAGRVPRAAFRPAPAVDGILRIDRRPEPLLPPAALPAYRRLVELGFGGFGGSLAASLRTAHPARRVDGALRAARLDPDTPVGLVWPEQWLVLFRLLHAVHPGRRSPDPLRPGSPAPRPARRGRRTPPPAAP